MAKRKRRSKRARARRAAANPLVRGQQAFRHGDYNGAIAAWEQAYKKDRSPKLAAALAEVHFRRGLARFYKHHQTDAGLRDLDQATRLAPDDPRYAYHLGLAHHRLGDLETARTAYHLALEADPAFHRAAELYVLVLLEQGQNPLQSAAWRALPLKRQTALRPLVGLIQGNAAAVQTQPARSDLDRLWQGLIACQSGDAQTRDLLLPLVQKSSLPEAVRAVAAYALGLDALRHDRSPEALDHWETARQLGLNTPTFHHNLSLLYRQQAEQAATEEGWPQAASLAGAAAELTPADRAVKKLAVTAYLHLGYAEAQAGRWAQALTHWQEARDLGENSRALLQNMALAYEKTEQFREAADLWRQVIRRRPRKKDAPDALTPQQVALLWGHVAECYLQAGDAGEAVTTLRNALKNDPTNTDLHLKLVDLLMARGQWEAARNQVNRLLKQEPNHIEALVRAARIEEENRPWWWLITPGAAQRPWKKILELDPNHLEARERLAELLYRQGRQAERGGKHKQALKSYRQALEYIPDQPILYLAVAECLFRLKRQEEARREMARAFALDPTDLDIYHAAVDLCHTVEQPDEAEWVIAQAEEQAGPLPASFYLDLARCCFKRDEQEQGREYVQRAEQRAVGDADALVDVGVFYLNQNDIDRAIPFFDQALRLDPDHGWANYHAGVSYAFGGDTREANRYWRRARRAARKSGDQDLLEIIEGTRRYLESPFGPSPGLPLFDSPFMEDMSPEDIMDLLLMLMGEEDLDDELW